MKRIMIIGCGGSGKSTLSEKIAERLQIPFISLDQYFFNPGWQEVERNKWQEINKRLVAQAEWVMDGNYGSSIDLRIPRADTIIFLHFPTRTCLSRVVRRTFRHYGKTRPGMAAGCRERISLKFWHYVLMYNKTRAPKLLVRLSKLRKEKKIFILRNQAEVDNFWRGHFEKKDGYN